MPSPFEELVAATGAAALLALHGEPATLTPAGGAPKTIKVIVDRQPLAVDEFEGAKPEYEFVVLAARADYGALTVNGDTLALRKRVTDTTDTTFTVKELLRQAGGMWELGIG